MLLGRSENLEEASLLVKIGRMEIKDPSDVVTLIDIHGQLFH